MVKEANPEDNLLFVPADIEASTPKGKMIVFNADTGEGLWAFNVNGPFGGGAVFSIDRQTAYFSTEDLHVYALKTTNGEIVWDFNSKYSILAEPVLGGNGVIYVGDMEGRFYALDAKTGKLNWEKRVGTEGIWARAVLGLEDLKRVVYVATLDTTSPNVFALDATTGEEVWKTGVDGAVTSDPVLSRDVKKLFVGTSGIPSKSKAKVVAIRVTTREELWSQDVGEASDLSPSIALSHNGNAILVTHQSGMVMGLGADHGSVEMSRVVSKSAIISNGLFVQDSIAIFTSTDGGLYEARLDNNATRPYLNAGSPIWGRPVMSSEGMIFFATIDGDVFALEHGSTKPMWRKKIRGGYVAASPALL